MTGLCGRQPRSCILLAVYCSLAEYHPCVSQQHPTLLTASSPGGIRQAAWSGVIAYTSFEEPARADGVVLGAGLAYFDTATACTSDHELLLNTGQAPVRHSTCSTGIYELGFRSFYAFRPGAALGLCDGDDVGVIGDASTSQGGGGGVNAPRGTQYYMIEDAGAGFVWVAMDSVDVSRHTGVSVSFWLRIADVNWEALDTIKVWVADHAGNEQVMIEGAGGGVSGVLAGLSQGQWLERTYAVSEPVRLSTAVVMSFGLQSNSQDEEAWFDYFRVEGTGERPPSYTYLVGGCEPLSRLGCSNVPDTCGPCIEGHHAFEANENSNAPCETCASLNRSDTGSPLSRWMNHENPVCKTCLPGYVAFSAQANTPCYTDAQHPSLCPHHPLQGYYYTGTRVIACMDHVAAIAAPAAVRCAKPACKYNVLCFAIRALVSCFIWLRLNVRCAGSFEGFCPAVGVCPTESVMRGPSSYCLQTDELLTIEKLPSHNNASEPLISHTRTDDLTRAWYAGGLGWATYWRPSASKVGNATCTGCPANSAQANACHVMGATLAEDVPHKPTPHGKQHYVIGGGSEGYFFVVVDPVSVDPTRSSYMSAWVHVAGSVWDGASVSSLDGAFVNVWATVSLSNGSVTDVYLLQTEGKDIHAMNWDDSPNHVMEDLWVRYAADLPPTTVSATMKFGGDVPDSRASIWFDNLEIACTSYFPSVCLAVRPYLFVNRRSRSSAFRLH